MNKFNIVNLKKGCVYSSVFPIPDTSQFLVCGDVDGNLYTVENYLKEGSTDALHIIKNNIHTQQICSVCFDSNGSKLYVAAKDCKITSYSVDTTKSPLEFSFEKIICRTEMTPNSICLNKDNSKLVICSNEDNIRIISMESDLSQQVITNAHEGGSLFACFSSGDMLATLGNDKTIKIWNLAEKSSPLYTISQVFSKELNVLWLTNTSEEDMNASKLMVWNNIGDTLFVLKQNTLQTVVTKKWNSSTRYDNFVTTVNQEVTFRNAYAMSLSPNGVYMVICDVEYTWLLNVEFDKQEKKNTSAVISKLQNGKGLITSLLWSPQVDSLIISNHLGHVSKINVNELEVSSFKMSHSKYFVEAEFAMNEEEAEGQEKAQTKSFLDIESKDDKEEQAEEEQVEEETVDEEMLEDVEEIEEEGENIDDEEDEEDNEHFSLTRERLLNVSKAKTVSPASISVPSFSKIEQPCVIPGRTAFDKEDRRFLCYNHIGYAVATKTDSQSTDQYIEVEFHEAIKYKDRFTDYSQIIGCAISNHGVAFISSKSKTIPSKLIVKSTKSTNQWSVSFAEDEVVETVAISEDYVIVSVNNDHYSSLRIYSINGNPKCTMSMAGKVIAMTCVSIGKKSKLFIVYQSGYHYNDAMKLIPQLHYQLVDICEMGQTHAKLFKQDTLPIATLPLQWIGFTSSAFPLFMDAQFKCHCFNYDFDSWNPICQIDCGNNQTVFVASATDEKLSYCLCKQQNSGIPQILPRPTMSYTDFKCLYLLDDSKFMTSEQQYMWKKTVLNQKKRVWMEQNHSGIEEMINKFEKQDTTVDREILAILFDLVNGHLYDRAIDLFGQLQTEKATDLAKNLFSSHNLFSLLKTLQEVKNRNFSNDRVWIPNHHHPLAYQQKQEIPLVKSANEIAKPLVISNSIASASTAPEIEAPIQQVSSTTVTTSSSTTTTVSKPSSTNSSSSDASFLFSPKKMRKGGCSTPTPTSIPKTNPFVTISVTNEPVKPSIVSENPAAFLSSIANKSNQEEGPLKRKRENKENELHIQTNSEEVSAKKQKTEEGLSSWLQQRKEKKQALLSQVMNKGSSTISDYISKFEQKQKEEEEEEEFEPVLQ